jgi:Pyruvate/2-oxoglutarate dehydrogenase complex, dihydrolipoamide acyltransferase (E2) component, and related enzymes
MTVELIVPTLGESITEATVSKWLKKIGEPFDIDEPLVEIETDKITVEVPAPQAGSLSEIKVQEGADINIGGVLGIIGDSKVKSKSVSDKNKISKTKIKNPNR